MTATASRLPAQGMEMLAQSEGMSFTYVPYKGMAPTITGFPLSAGSFNTSTETKKESRSKCAIQRSAIAMPVDLKVAFKTHRYPANHRAVPFRPAASSYRYAE